MNHPLNALRRRQLARYRLATRLFGCDLTGRLSSALYRRSMLSCDAKSYYILSTQPLIIYLGGVMDNVFDVAELLKHRCVYFIKNFNHTFQKHDRLDQLQKEVCAFREYYPQHRIVFISAAEREQEMLQERGIEPVYFINKNAFIDESIFRFVPNQEKDFNAIHNAQLARYKRHELAAHVRNLAIITYRHPHIGRNSDSARYADDIRYLLRNATWLNRPGSPLPPREVPALLNRARVGLCLSAEEGVFGASMEYLLCGLPIVSTRSIGGRDVFFDDEYVKIVDDSAESVAAGVKEMIGRQVNPELIRQRTLQKVDNHRRRFVSLVEQIMRDAGQPRSFQDDFENLFVTKLKIGAPFPGAFLKHVAKGMPVDLCRQLAENQMS